MPFKNEEMSKALTDAVKEAFKTMMSMDMADADVAPTDVSTAELICTIGLAGKLEGSVTVAVSNASACAIVSAMLGMEMTEMSSDVCDGMCEVANVIAGGVKTRLAHLNCPFNLSIPTVVRGQVMRLNVAGDLRNINRRFSADKVSLDVEFVFKMHEEAAAASPAASPAASKMSAFEKLKAMTAKAA